ncbi:MAG: hypothetical protein NVS9B2_23380 [Steroidobacteraceae bacterium]
MLYNDATWITAADLEMIDSEAPSIATAESIPINGAGNIADQTIQEVGDRILSESQAFSAYNPPYSTPYSQTAAVLNAMGPTTNRSRVALAQIVVTEPASGLLQSNPGNWSSLKRYAVYECLRLFYRSAFYRKMNDRYQNRMVLYTEDIRKFYWPRFYNKGVPIAYKPLPCPGAIRENRAGIWSLANVTTVAGTNANAATYYDVVTTWTDATNGYVTPTTKANAESGGSARITLSVPTNNVLQVSIAGLTPPDGTAPANIALGQGLIVPGIASGWNVYVGLQGSGLLYLQNLIPVAIATKTYTLAGAPVLTGNTLDTGQFAQAYYSFSRSIMRA